MFGQRHFWLSALIVIGITSFTEPAFMIFFFGSLDNYTVTALNDPLRILPYFNKSQNSVFLVHGFSESANKSNLRLVLSAYLKLDNANAVMLDWAKEAEIGPEGLEESYAYRAVPNSKTVGEEFGRSLVTFIENGVGEDTIHIVGHSLGAQLSGYAGAEVQKYCYNISRITGLDPAGPLFQSSTGTTGLNTSNGKFVDILHTDPILYGVNQSIGDVDFWANCGSALQPGCENNSSSTAIDNSFCSHQLSCKIYAEAVLNPTAFPTAYAANCSEWHLQSCTSEIIYLGDLVDTCARGNFYFSTNGVYPLAKGVAGLEPNN